MKLRTVIADDEQLARKLLRELLSTDTSIEVTAECRNGAELISLLKSEAVDLLFLDIQMPGGTGFEVMEQIGAARMPPTVFVTAHNEYAVRAFEVHALDYLTKQWKPIVSKSHSTMCGSASPPRQPLITQAQMQAVLSNLVPADAPAERYVKRLLVPDVCMKLSFQWAISIGSKQRITTPACMLVPGNTCCTKPRSS